MAQSRIHKLRTHLADTEPATRADTVAPDENDVQDTPTCVERLRKVGPAACYSHTMELLTWPTASRSFVGLLNSELRALVDGDPSPRSCPLS